MKDALERPKIRLIHALDDRFTDCTAGGAWQDAGTIESLLQASMVAAGHLPAERPLEHPPVAVPAR